MPDMYTHSKDSGETIVTYSLENASFIATQTTGHSEEDALKLGAVELDGPDYTFMVRFDFKEPFQSRFNRLVSMALVQCSGDSQTVLDINESIRAETGHEVLQIPILREVLVGLCFKGSGFPEKRPQAEKLIRLIAEQGPPAFNSAKTFPVRCGIAVGPWGGIFRPGTVAVLVRNKWYAASRFGLCVPVFSSDRGLIRDQMDLFDALVEHGGSQAIRDDFSHLMRIAVRHAPVEVLRHVTKTMPLVPTLPRWEANELVAQACDPPCEDREMLEFLLGQGLDVDAVGRTTAGETQSALHGAAAHGNLKAVELLWGRGAKVLWDGSKRNALDRARLGEHKAVVRFLEDAFDRKGIQHDYGEEPPVVPEKQAFLEELARVDRERGKSPRQWWQFWKLS